MRTEKYSLDAIGVQLRGVLAPFAASTASEYVRIQYSRNFCGGLPSKYFKVIFDTFAFDALVLEAMTDALRSNFDIEGQYDYIHDIRVTDYALRDNEFIPTDIEIDVDDNATLGAYGDEVVGSFFGFPTIDLDATSVYMSSIWHEMVDKKLDKVTGTDAPELIGEIDPRWTEFYADQSPAMTDRYSKALKAHKWAWYNYCSKHLELEVKNDKHDLVCWAIDNRVDYDEFFGTAPSTDTTTQQSTNTTTPNTTTTMTTTTTKPTNWKMAPATHETDLEQTYGSKFTDAFAIVLDPTDNITLGDMPRTWSYRGGNNNVIVATVDGIAELTYECQWGKRTQYVTHNGVKYIFESVPKMKAALETCFDEDGNATDDIWQYCMNKPKSEKKAETTERKKPAPKAETKTTKKETAKNETTPAPQASVANMRNDRTYTDGKGQYYHIYTDNDGELVYVFQTNGKCNGIRIVPNGDYDRFVKTLEGLSFELCETPQTILVAIGKAASMTASDTAKPSTDQPKTAEPKKAETQAAQPSMAQPKTAEPKAEGTQAPTEAQTKTAEPKTAEPKTAEPKTETKTEPKAAETKGNVVPISLPDTITVSALSNGSVTLGGLTELTAEQIAIFVAGMNAMKEAIKKQMSI